MDADYSQIELRILAHCSDDEALIQAYREAKDIHRNDRVPGVPYPFRGGDGSSEEKRQGSQTVRRLSTESVPLDLARI